MFHGERDSCVVRGRVTPRAFKSALKPKIRIQRENTVPCFELVLSMNKRDHHKSRSERRLEKKIGYIKDLIDQAEVLTIRNERLSNEEKYRQLVKTRDAISDYLRQRLSGSALMLLCTDLAQEEYRESEKRVEEQVKTVQLDRMRVHKFEHAV